MKKYFYLIKKYNLIFLTVTTMALQIFLNVLETFNVKIFANALNDIMNKTNWLLIATFGIADIVFNKITYELIRDMSEKFKYRYKNDLYNKVTNLSINSLGESSLSKIVSALDMADDVGDNLLKDFPEWVIYLVTCLVTSLFILAKENWILLLIVIIEILPIAFYIYRNKSKVKDICKEQKDVKLKSFTSIERLKQYLVIKSFSKERYEQNKFEKLTAQAMSINKKKTHMMINTTSAVYTMQTILNLTWVIYGAYSFYNGSFNIPQIYLFSKLTGNILNPLYNISNIMKEVNDLNVQIDIAEEIFSMETEYDSTIKLNNFDSSIEFQDVSFRYDNSIDVLNNINFSIKKGQRIGIYGESGVGKSSLVNLLMRFYQVSSGKILIDGIDINDFTKDSLRKHIGIINQDIHVFSDMNIRDNITYGVNGNVSEVDIVEAAKKAHCHDFIKKLPNGYDSFIGNDGVKLSGGEKQRIAIARLFLLNPEILILDEATSKLDNISEIFIKDAIGKLSEDKTVISIAHRFSTIENSDLLIGIQDHTIKEIGKKKELDKEGTLFYKLYHATKEV